MYKWNVSIQLNSQIHNYFSIEAYFSANTDVNIIGLDHSQMPNWNWNYFECATNAEKLGSHVGQILQKILINEFGQTGDQIHIIGHSLGAHLAGFIARKMSAGNDSISRVTGNT